MNKLLNLHINNGYYVKVKSLSKMAGCLVNFPANIMLHKPETQITYIINDEYIEKFCIEAGKKIASKKIDVDKFATRLLILEDITLQAFSRNISRYLIITEDTKNIFNILDINATQEELVLEKELCLCFRELLLGKVDHDVKNKLILGSYKKVLECFENGGL